MKDDDRQVSEFARRYAKKMFPNLKESALFVSILPNEDPAPESCLDLGAAILYDKPIVIMVLKGNRVPAALRRAADRLIEVEEFDDDAKLQLQAAMEEVEALHFPEKID